MAKEEKKLTEKYPDVIICVGRQTGYSKNVYELLKKEEDGTYSLTGKELSYSQNLYRTDSVGAIYSIERTEKGLNYPTKPIAAFIYSNLREEVTERIKKARVLDLAIRNAERDKTFFKEATSFENMTLEELKKYYGKARWEKREFIMARIIRIVTS